MSKLFKFGKEYIIRPVEIWYNGYWFRATTEARWAWFCNALGIECIYEPDTFDLHGVWYCPDFWVPCWDAFVEIKPSEPSQEEIHKCVMLSSYWPKKRVYLFIGDPLTRRGYLFKNGKTIKLPNPFTMKPESFKAATEARSFRFEKQKMNWPKAA